MYLKEAMRVTRMVLAAQLSSGRWFRSKFFYISSVKQPIVKVLCDIDDRFIGLVYCIQSMELYIFLFSSRHLTILAFELCWMWSTIICMEVAHLTIILSLIRSSFSIDVLHTYFSSVIVWFVVLGWHSINNFLSHPICIRWHKISLQIVPGYFLRRNTDGFIEHSTCVNNTASEHYMVERLIVDDLLCWAMNYKVIITTYLVFFVSWCSLCLFVTSELISFSLCD